MGGVVTFDMLKSHAAYEGGFTETSATVVHFWAVVESMSDEQRAQLHRFVTGTSRAGGGGLSARLVVSHGGGPERYPRASTCFRTLYLPAFDTVGLMRSRLLEALECTGFDLA